MSARYQTQSTLPEFAVEVSAVPRPRESGHEVDTHGLTLDPIAQKLRAYADSSREDSEGDER